MNLIVHHGWTIFRWGLVCGVLCLAVAPALPLIFSALTEESTQPVWTDAFRKAMLSTWWLGVGVSILSLLIGLPLGLLAALYRFPGRRPLLLFQALPLLLPSFLPCIGWSNLAAARWLSWLPTPDGFAGCLFVLGLQGAAIPLFATWAACQNLTASQVDAARLHGGEREVLKLSARASFPVAMLAALLAGILSLSDPGAPLIMGVRSVDGKPATRDACLLIRPHRRGIAMLFQDLALWPNLTASGNVRLGLSGLRLPGNQVRQRIDEALVLCGISDLANRRPGTLSGGQQQRVALARALAMHPRLLLLDEPMGGLDLMTKQAVLQEIARLRGDLEFGILLVTHDPTEVRGLCTSLAVLENRRIVEHGSLEEIGAHAQSALGLAFAQAMQGVQDSSV